MNPQSVGEVTLNSSNPSDPPKVDPKLLTHPFDRRVIIEAMRKLMEYLEAPVFKKDTLKMIGCPKGKSDEEIWVCFLLFILIFNSEKVLQWLTII
jgi:choline dehydrogenase-like flavoprotein